MKNRSNPDFVVPDFTPVPRQHRVDGWTPARQRAFIAALAATGSVTAAARSINMAKEGAYMLRLHPQGAGFRAAWEAALTAGLDRLGDIAMERAIEGVPVPVFYKGEQCGEKRWYNDRLLMFILRHRNPEKYGAPAALPRGTRHPDTLAREEAPPPWAAPMVPIPVPGRNSRDAGVTYPSSFPRRRESIALGAGGKNRRFSANGSPPSRG